MLVGSIGVVLSVPVTTWLAASVLTTSTTPTHSTTATATAIRRVLRRRLRPQWPPPPDRSTPATAAPTSNPGSEPAPTIALDLDQLGGCRAIAGGGGHPWRVSAEAGPGELQGALSDPWFDEEQERWSVPPGLVVLVLGLIGLFPGAVGRYLDGPAVATWTTIFVAVSVQAMPFLVLGVLVSALIAGFLPAGALARRLPKRPILSVPLAGAAGVALPGCECASVPIAGRLVAAGTPSAAALTFLLAAPAVNPVVIVATAVAFPGRPEMAAARFAASLLAAIAVGLLWSRVGRDEWLARAHHPADTEPRRWAVFAETATHDFVHTGAFLVLGAMAAATMHVVVPPHWLDGLASSGLTAYGAMAVLAVVLAICSEADAFVAAGLSQFSLRARLVFLVVGPMVDLKLMALQSGTFSGSFAARFAPLTLACAVTAATLVGWALL